MKKQTRLSSPQFLPELLSLSFAPDSQAESHRANILIVDNDEVTLKALCLRLQAAGYEVSPARDVPEALGCVRRKRPDVIVLEIDFPPDGWNGGILWDGFLILDWLRRLEETCSAPVIFITTTDLASCHEKALRAGAVGLFQKPIRYDELVRVIQDAVALARLRPQGEILRRIWNRIAN